MTSDVKLSYYFLLKKSINRDMFLTLIIQKTVSKHHPFLFWFKCFEVRITTWIDTTANIFLWISCFTIILLQCRGSPWYQVLSKIPGTEILLISETWFQFYQRQPREVFYKERCSSEFCNIQGNTCARVSFYAAALFGTGVFLWILYNTFGWLLLFYNSCCLYTLQLYIADNFQVVKSQ